MAEAVYTVRAEIRGVDQTPLRNRGCAHASHAVAD